jgi:hypothetical protein
VALQRLGQFDNVLRRYRGAELLLPSQLCHEVVARANQDFSVNRPGLVGVFIVWKRGWTHAEGHDPGEADDASLQPG